MEGLYAIVDPEHCRRRDPVWVGERILHGGCAALQLRAKHMGGRDRLTTARALSVRCREAGVPFWINDHLDLALLVEADGLHLGQDDIPISEVRSLWGDRPIGLSTHNASQVRMAKLMGANMIGFGPVFQTSSKQNPDPVVGVTGVAEATRITDLPVVAIGGIDHERASLLCDSGARYAAVISAVCQADDPASAARALHSTLTRGA